MPTEAEFIGLHIDLYEGQRAQLETVAAASIAYATLVREIGFLLDPSIEFKVELLSGTEGSLNLNTIIKTVKKITNTTFGMAIITVLGFLATDMRQYGMTAGMDVFFKGHPAQLSNDQLRQITELVVKIEQDKVATTQRQRIYGELEKDPAVRGFGATDRLNGQPIFIIPRDHFARLSLPDAPQELEVSKRERTITQLVTLVSPILLHGNRKWRFRTDQGEFTAPVLDQNFLDGILSGRRRMPMKAGIQLLVKLKIEETKEDGVWVITDRKIMSVIRVPKQPLQTTLDFSSEN